MLLAALAAPAAVGALALSAGSAAAASSGGVAPGPLTHAHRASRHTALATWFGPGFFGRETACGQTLLPGTVGVANRTLPCGTLVLIAHRGRSITVPVIDRGPYGVAGADWDLTAGAAAALGVSDTIRVTSRILGRVVNSPQLGAPVVPAGTPQGGTLAGGSPPA
jgi:rare lipoprotein A (peptidoglycan hydrolase)